VSAAGGRDVQRPGRTPFAGGNAPAGAWGGAVRAAAVFAVVLLTRRLRCLTGFRAPC